MKNVEFLSVLIYFNQLPETGKLDLGTVTLKKDNREYELDIIGSTVERQSENHCDGNVLCTVEPFTLENGGFSRNDLTAMDLTDLDSASIYLGDNLEENPDHATLFVRFANISTKAIDLTIE